MLRPPSRRPATVAELEWLARMETPWVGVQDPQKSIKDWLRLGGDLRKHAGRSTDRGEIEDAFIHYTRAAIITLNTIPAHCDYVNVLTEQQRLNLSLVSAKQPVFVYLY
jgi:hypothetical protein